MESLEITRNIKRFRNVKGMTQKEMADALAMDERTYSNFERGLKKAVDVKLLLAISRILDTDLNTLIGAEVRKERNSVAEIQLQSLHDELYDLRDLLLSELKAIRREMPVMKTV